MRILQSDLESLTESIFLCHGASAENARTMAEELVLSDMYGVHSHGVLRVRQYCAEIKCGQLQAGAAPIVRMMGNNAVLVDMQHGFGHVAARRLCLELIEGAKRNSIYMGMTKKAQHVGRIGSYTERIAKAGYLTWGCAAVETIGPMAPWGSFERRLGTNPISWAAPCENEPVIFSDFATTRVSEGKIRTYIQEQKSIPQGWLMDENGQFCTDPSEFYSNVKTSIPPMGEHKGYGLALMADFFTFVLSGLNYWEWKDKFDDEDRAQNALTLIVINPEFFCGVDFFKRTARKHADFVSGARPILADKPVKLPGEYEAEAFARAKREAIELPDALYSELLRLNGV